MDQRILKMLNEKYPFIALCVYAGVEYVGIIQNRDDDITTIYDFSCIADAESREKFLELANIWWWESNRSVPINIFLRHEWDPYRHSLRTFSNRDLDIVHGPICSLIGIDRKKHKRKSITLVRKTV